MCVMGMSAEVRPDRGGSITRDGWEEIAEAAVLEDEGHEWVGHHSELHRSCVALVSIT